MPNGPGETPDASARADCQKVWVMPASNSEVSTLWPRPECWRSSSAARTPNAARMPAVMSVIGAPCYIYNDEPFWGQDRLEFLDRALAKDGD